MTLFTSKLFWFILSVLYVGAVFVWPWIMVKVTYSLIVVFLCLLTTFLMFKLIWGF